MGGHEQLLDEYQFPGLALRDHQRFLGPACSPMFAFKTNCVHIRPNLKKLCPLRCVTLSALLCKPDFHLLTDNGSLHAAPFVNTAEQLFRMTKSSSVSACLLQGNLLTWAVQSRC